MTDSHTRLAYAVVRCTLGSILLVAAALKAHQLATQPLAEDSVLTSRAVLILWFEVEILLGLWLFSGLFPRAAWVTAVGCFSLFSAVTGFKAVSGETSCGCFGVVEVSPWYTLILDVGAVTALILVRPDLRTSWPVPGVRRRLAAAILVALAGGVPAGLAAAFYQPAALSEDGEIIGDARFVVLEPPSWSGQRFPLLKYIDISDRIGKGRWTVVLYHHDCPHCQERLPEYEREARQESLHRGITAMAMVELPPYAPAGRSLIPADSPCTTGRVSDVRDWFVETPTVVVLEDGVVEGGPEDTEPEPAVQQLAAAPAAAPAEQPVEVKGDGYDFGFVDPKSPHQVLLAIPNPSGRPATIKAVRSECKCMTAKAASVTVAPGAPIVISVAFVAPDKPMRYDKRFLIQSDDKDHPSIPIHIRADIGLALQVEPASLAVGPLRPGEMREESVTVRNRGRTAVRLIYSTSSGPGCFARVPREAVPPQGVLRLPIVVTGPDGSTRSVTLNIATDLALQPTVSVSILLGDASGAPTSASGEKAGAVAAARTEAPDTVSR